MALRFLASEAPKEGMAVTDELRQRDAAALIREREGYENRRFLAEREMDPMRVALMDSRIGEVDARLASLAVDAAAPQKRASRRGNAAGEQR